MSALFPAPTNDQYQGSRISLLVLALSVITTLIPSLIHTFLPDGGANVIAGVGLDLASAHGQQVVRLFAWAGVTQFVWGLIQLTVLLRYRALVPLMLGLLALERLMHCWHLWGPKSGDHHPPEAYATLFIIPILLLGFILALRNRQRKGTE